MCGSIDLWDVKSPHLHYFIRHQQPQSIRPFDVIFQIARLLLARHILLLLHSSRSRSRIDYER
jgi:hypothetical protein